MRRKRSSWISRTRDTSSVSNLVLSSDHSSLQRVSCRLVSTFDSLVHVCPVDLPHHLAPVRRLHPPRLHPGTTPPPSPKILPISHPRVYHLRSTLVIRISTPRPTFLPNIHSGLRLGCSCNPPHLVARDCLRLAPPRHPPDPWDSK